MVSGFARNAVLSENEFAWTGDTAMAAWGYTDELSEGGTKGWDGSAGDHPYNTTVHGNVIRETGIWEKQSSCWFQAKAAKTTLTNNVCYNLARAGFNFNDGFGGGDYVANNLIFNSCRESADHGPINSWDRQPFVTKVRAELNIHFISCYSDWIIYLLFFYIYKVRSQPRHCIRFDGTPEHHE